MEKNTHLFPRTFNEASPQSYSCNVNLEILETNLKLFHKQSFVLHFTSQLQII